MKITILNKCFFSKSHIKRLKKLGIVKSFFNTHTETEAIERLKGVEIAVANGLYAPLTENVLKKANSLKLLVVNSTGFDFVDIDIAKKMGIKVANTPGFATDAAAEHTIALMFAVIKKIVNGNRAVKKKPFEINPARQSDHRFLGSNIKGKTLGIIGFGSIGKRTAELGIGLGMRVIAYTKSPEKTHRVKFANLIDLLKKSDVISIHVPLNSETEKLIGKKELALLKPTAILINTARGDMVNTKALYNALRKHRIAGAGLDVFTGINRFSPILKLDNAVFTPHSAWWTEESISGQAEIIVSTIKSFINKKPINIVN